MALRYFVAFSSVSYKSGIYVSITFFAPGKREGRMETCVVSLKSATAAGDRMYYKCLAKNSEQLPVVGQEHCGKNQPLTFFWQIATVNPLTVL